MIGKGKAEIFESAKARKHYKQCKRACKNPYSRNNGDDVNGIAAAFREQIPAGYVKGEIQGLRFFPSREQVGLFYRIIFSFDGFFDVFNIIQGIVDKEFQVGHSAQLIFGP